MREIEFRGVDIASGKTIYSTRYDGVGDLVFMYDWRHQISRQIIPESVRQLVGADKNGRKVYEYDAVQKDGQERKADMTLIYTIGNYELVEK